MSKQSDFDKCLMSQIEGYRKKIHGENFSPRQKELFPGLKRDLNMEIEDVARSDDPLEACMERRGYKPSKTQVFQDAISAKLTADMFGKQEKLTGAEAMFQEQMQECLDRMKDRPKLKFGRLTDSLPPILGWVGGKTKLANKIISMMPEHKVYVEPFLGGGSVFFKKSLADVNVINDLNKDLISFYKGVRDGGCEKVRACKIPKNRLEFDRAVKSMGDGVCNYLGVNKMSYGCDSNGPRFSNAKAKQEITAVNFREKCDRYKDKLKEAKILNKDYKDVVKEYDSKDTLVYMDPPYFVNDDRLYNHSEFNPEDVANLVKSMKGKAIISYNEHPQVRKAFAGLNFHKVKTRYSIQTGATKNVSELIITNF